ncbi:MAG: hypothetical protein QXY61_02065 [Candidatus Anstonellales archaeon]
MRKVGFGERLKSTAKGYFNHGGLEEYTIKRLNKLAFKWMELLGEKERKLENGYRVERIKEGKEGELGPMVAAFAYMFQKLAYGDRSKFGKDKLDEFISFAEMLWKLLHSTKANAEKQVYKIEEEYSKNWWSRFELWVLKKIMFRQKTIGWWDSVRDTAGRTIEEIEQAVTIIKEKYEL